MLAEMGSRNLQLAFICVLFFTRIKYCELHNCSHCYVIRIANGRSQGGARTFLKDSCLQSSPTLNVSNNPECSLLHNILQGFNDVITDGDCLELNFMPGEYWFPSMDQIQISYSLVLSAPKGGVSIACSHTSEKICPINKKEKSSPDTANVTNKFIMAVNGSLDRDVFVSINSLDFSNCSKRIQLNLLSNVSIINSTFSKFSSSVLDLFNVNNTVLSLCSFADCTSCQSNPQYRSNAGAVSMAYYFNGTSQTDPQIEIVNCSFRNNKAYQNYTDQFDVFNSVISGRGGAIGIHTEGSQSNVHASIKDCTFTGNWAEIYGGGIWVIFSGENTWHELTLDNCTFVENGCGPIGNGGAVNVAILLSDDKSRPVKTLVTNCYFEGNHANFGGGLSFLEVYRETRGNDLMMYNTAFVKNHASQSGAAIVLETFSYVQNRLKRYYYNFTDCVFQENEGVGGTFGASFNSIDFFGNIMFLNNSGPALRLVGSLARVHEKMSFVGNTIPHNGQGGALFLQAFGQVQVRPGTTLSFVNNTGNVGAAIVVDVQRSSPVFLELLFNPQCFLLYDNPRKSPKEWENRYPTDILWLYLMAVSHGCTVQAHYQSSYSNHGLAGPGVQVFWAFTATFTVVESTQPGNKARVGPAVYASHLNHCAWYATNRNDYSNNPTKNSYNESVNPYEVQFSVELFRNWTAFNIEETNEALSQKDSTSDRKYYFQTDSHQIVSPIETNQLVMRPGQTSPIDLVALDLFNNPTILIARISDYRLGINSGAFNQEKGDSDAHVTNRIIFDPSLLALDPEMRTANLKFGFSGNNSSSNNDGDDDEDDLTLRNSSNIPIAMDMPFNIIHGTPFIFNLTMSLCDPGYVLKGGQIKMCHCSNDNKFILNCNDEGGLILKDGTWAGADPTTGSSLDITICPFPYCSCQVKQTRSCHNMFSNNNPNQQCHSTREGILCGRCVVGSAVGVLRTNCRVCEDNVLYGIAVLVVGDLLVMAVFLFAFMKLDFYFPYSLRGLLFYIQTVYYATESFPISFWDIRKYMLYISSALSLYFPYDFCLSPATSTLSTFGLKLVPPAIALVLCLVVATGVHADRSHSGRSGRRHVWRALWFFLLLFYAPLLHTCAAILKCPILHSTTGKRHWFYDGEVECYKGSHVVFSVISILILIPLLLVIPILFTFSFVVHKKKNISSRTVERISLALWEGYRESGRGVQYYSVWELVRRLLLIAIVVFLPGRSVVALYVIVSCLAVHMYCKPYKMAFQNILEMFIFLDYTILLLLRSNATILDSANSGNYSGTMIPNNTEDSLPPLDNVAWLFIPPFYLPLVFATTLTLMVFVYRVIKYTKEKRKIKKVIYVRKDLLDVSASITAKSYPAVPTTTVERPLSSQYDSSFQ